MLFFPLKFSCFLKIFSLHSSVPLFLLFCLSLSLSVSLCLSRCLVFILALSSATPLTPTYKNFFLSASLLCLPRVSSSASLPSYLYPFWPVEKCVPRALVLSTCACICDTLRVDCVICLLWEALYCTGRGGDVCHQSLKLHHDGYSIIHTAHSLISLQQLHSYDHEAWHE